MVGPTCQKIIVVVPVIIHVVLLVQAIALLNL